MKFAQRPGQSAAYLEASLEYFIANAGRLQEGRTTSAAERAREKGDLIARQRQMALELHQRQLELQKRASQHKNSNELTRRIQSLLAAIAALQRAIDEALRTFAFETAAALTVVLLALMAELDELT